MSPLVEVALLFGRLGATAFGGPAAHIALMEDEVVRRRGWVTREEFLDLLGATNLIPGPNSTEMAIHLGLRRAGAAGLVVAGACFILPAAAMVLGLAWAYSRFGAVPRVAALLVGVKPVMIAVVAQALWGLGRTAIKSRPLAAIAVAATVASALGANELIVLAVAGLVAATWRGMASRPPASAPPAKALALLPLPLVPTAALATFAPATVKALFFAFLKIGSVLFGSGYVLLAFLRADFVEHHHWLRESQLLDAIAIGQLTPGPVLTTATFIGYLLGGVRGAAVSTLGIFLPGFVFVAASGPLIPRIRRSPLAGGLLDGVNVASLALMAVVAAQLGRAAIVSVPTALIAAASAVLLLRYRVNTVWLMLGGAIAGVALGFLQ